jgi:hypothetical protein
MGRRVRDEGQSECRPVMGWIGVAPEGNITPRASGLTSFGSFVTRELGKPIKETKQMTVALTAGAVSHTPVSWPAIDWQKTHRNVRRLQGVYRQGWVSP